MIGERAEVRKLIGGRSATLVPDATIDKALDFADSFCMTKTSYTGWSPADPDYESVKEASEHFAASRVMMQFIEEKDKADSLWKTAMEIITAVSENMQSGGTAGNAGTNVFNIVSGASFYRTFPLNPNGQYSRPNGRQSGTTSEGVERLYII